MQLGLSFCLERRLSSKYNLANFDSTAQYEKYSADKYAHKNYLRKYLKHFSAWKRN